MIDIKEATLNDLETIQKLYAQLFALMASYQPVYYQRAE